MGVFEQVLREKVRSGIEQSLKEQSARLAPAKVEALVDDRLRRIAELVYESYEAIARLGADHDNH